MKVSINMILILGGLFFFCFTTTLQADDSHYKNILVGDRAATMGGSYAAISDDASGTYYNPAGLVYAGGDSVSGSANTYNVSETKYKDAIGGKEWKRESSSLLPNFFGVVKKFGDSAFAFSYVVPNSMEEHQDQSFEGLSELGIYRYTLNLHSDDNTYLFGPSYSVQLTDSLSFGMTLYYYYRLYRIEKNEFIIFTNKDLEWTYTSSKLTEIGANPRIGFQWTPAEPLTIGLSYSKTVLTSSSYQVMIMNKNKADGIGAYTYFEDDEKRKPSTQVSLGIAYFASPFSLFTIDFDYFLPEEKELVKVLNYSAGAEFFLNEANAIRFGLFTNLTNQKSVGEDTTAPHEHMDMQGATAGYSLYSRSSSVTLGLVYSQGKGLAQLYSGSESSREMERSSLTFLFAASYGY